MINILQKESCCGCGACNQICSSSCIKMTEDPEGFLYPSVNIDSCIQCNKCSQVCLVVNQKNPRNPVEVYAVQNKDEDIRLESSSGGIFTAIAEQIINEGGVVFGARFNEEWEVVHGYTETLEGLAAFRGSKYVQSVIHNTFIQAHDFLQQGRKVLFSGTPCQVMGLKKFVNREYDNLFTLDIICHGVPSPKIWKLYIEEICKKKFNGQKILNIEFRNKIRGWRHYSFRVEGLSKKEYVNKNIRLQESRYRNIYLQGFLNDIFLRPSCHYCPVKSFRSGSDITVADFWAMYNYLPEYDDDKGTSLVFVFTDKALAYYQSLKNLDGWRLPENVIERVNGSAYSCPSISKNRERFMEKFVKQEYNSISELIAKYIDLPFYYRMKNMIRIIVSSKIIHVFKYCWQKVMRFKQTKRKAV